MLPFIVLLGSEKEPGSKQEPNKNWVPTRFQVTMWLPHSRFVVAWN